MARSIGAKDKQKRAPGSGRKPKAFTLLKARIEAEKKEDAEYAFAMYASVMRDGGQPISLRLECANWVANRVLGLPKAPTEMSGNVTYRLEYVNDWRVEANQIADATFRAKDDSEQQSALQVGERGTEMAQDHDGADARN